MKTGDTVRFVNPEASEVDDVFVVIEDRGDRVLVGDVDCLSIPTTAVYLKSDLMVVKGAK